MSRNMRTAIAFLGSIIVIAILSVMVYYAGVFLAKSFIGVSGGSLSSWGKLYQKMVISLGCLTGFTVIGWLVMTNFVLKVNQAVHVGQRMLWAGIGLVNVLICVVYPYIYVKIHSQMIMDIKLTILFILLYSLIGYWLVSIFATPDAYKYTPLLAEKFRMPKGRHAIGGN